MICPLHGPALSNNLDNYISKYSTWSSYAPENDGIVIAYTSIYGNTRRAALALKDKLHEKGCSTVILIDLARTEWSQAVAVAFQYNKLVLATTTYNSDIFPYMRQFIDHLSERNFQNRAVGFIEHGSWAPTAIKIMRGLLEGAKSISFINSSCSIRSALNNENLSQLDDMATELCSK